MGAEFCWGLWRVVHTARTKAKLYKCLISSIRHLMLRSGCVKQDLIFCRGCMCLPLLTDLLISNVVCH